jgi:hypothetical protein
MNYKLIINSADGNNLHSKQYAVREFKNDIAAIKEFRSQVRMFLLKEYVSVDCAVFKESTKIFDFTESRESDQKRTIKFLHR